MQEKEDVTKTPEIQKIVMEGSATKPKAQRGIVLINYIPRDLCEKDVRNFYEEFGTVTRMKLQRNIIIGGHAFIEFRYEQVAKIAADTISTGTYGWLKAHLIKKGFPKAFWEDTSSMALAKSTNKWFVMKKAKTTNEWLASKKAKLANEWLVTKKKIKNKRFASKKAKLANEWLVTKKKIETFVSKNAKPTDEWIITKKKFQELVKKHNHEFNEELERGDFILFLDESDNEIEFNLPPHYTIIKLLSSCSQTTGKEVKSCKTKQKAGSLGLRKIENEKSNRYFRESLGSDATTKEAVLPKKTTSAKSASKLNRADFFLLQQEYADKDAGIIDDRKYALVNEEFLESDIEMEFSQPLDVTTTKMNQSHSEKKKIKGQDAGKKGQVSRNK